MQRIKSQLRKLRDAFSLDELIVLGLVLSVFLTIYATAACTAAVMIYLIWKNKLIPLLASVPKAFMLPVFGALTLTVSIFYRNEQGLIAAVALSAFMIVALFIRSVMTERLFESLLDVSCAASIISVLVITVQILVSPGGVEIRAASTFMNANFYATIVEFVVLFSIHKLVRASKQKKFFYLAVLLANLAGLYMSNSRTAMLALALAVLFYFVISRQYRALIVSAAAAVGFALIICLMPAMQERILAVGIDMLDRVGIWRTAFRGITDSVMFGKGAGSYILTCIRYGGPIRPHAHNLFLELFLDFGVAGVFLISAYLKENLRAISLLQEKLADNSVQRLAQAVIFSVIIHGITDVTLLSLQTALLFFVVMGVAGIRESAVRPVPVVRPAQVVLDAFKSASAITSTVPAPISQPPRAASSRNPID